MSRGNEFTNITQTSALIRQKYRCGSCGTKIFTWEKLDFTNEVKQYVATTKGRLKIYQLPAYSPELNPDELVWNNAKQKVAKQKHTPTKKTFKQKVESVMDEIKKNTQLTKAFFYEPNVAYAM